MTGETFNVSTGKAVTVLELTETLLEVARSTMRPVFQPPDWTQGSCRVGNAAKIRTGARMATNDLLTPGALQGF